MLLHSYLLLNEIYKVLQIWIFPVFFNKVVSDPSRKKTFNFGRKDETQDCNTQLQQKENDQRQRVLDERKIAIF